MFCPDRNDGKETSVGWLSKPFLTAPFSAAIGSRFEEELRTVASNTKITENVRLRKKHTNGKKRKRALENKGTTKSEAAMFGNVLKKPASA